MKFDNILIPDFFTKYKIPDDKFLVEEYNFQRFLCEDCYIDIDREKDVYCKHFIRTCKRIKVNDYFGKGKPLYMNTKTLYKKRTNHIPFTHKEMKVHRKIYSINQDSDITCIIDTFHPFNKEKNTYDSSYRQIYMESMKPIDYTNYPTEENLCSLLSLFN